MIFVLPIRIHTHFHIHIYTMPEPGQKREKTHEEEIKELERLLEEKKRALIERGVEKVPKEAFREVMKEYVEAKKPPSYLPPSPVPVPASDDAAKKNDEQKKRIREAELDKLIAVSFEEGIVEAVNQAERTTPWLLDELHDRLVDEYYQKLVQSSKLKEL